MKQILIFLVEGRLFGIGVEEVERIIRAVALRPVPDPPEGMLGLINVAGRLLPVLDIRSRLGCPARELEIDDRIILLTGRRTVGVVVDGVVGVDSLDALDFQDPGQLHPDLEESLAGVGKRADEMVLVFDRDRLLAPLPVPEWDRISARLAQTARPGDAH